MRWVDRTARGAQRHRALNLVPELADIPRPPVLRKDIERFRAQLNIRFAESLRGFAEKKRTEVGNLFPSLPQRRHMDTDDGEAVIEILTELAFRDALLEVGIGRGEHSNVHTLRTSFPHRHDLGLFEKTQQLGLYVERKIADFIQEQRAPGRGSDEARLIGDCTRKRSAPVAEQLAVGQITAGRRAVVRKKHGGAPMRPDVNALRDEFLAGAALTGDEHGEVVALQPLNVLDEADHRRAHGDESGQQRLERTVRGWTHGPCR